MYLDNKIAFFQQEIKNKEEAFKILAEQLTLAGCVTDDYIANVIEREEKFPTGLSVNGIGVAIPHTDSDYVNRSQIAFLSTVEPVEFFEIGTDDNVVGVRLIFMLALKEPHEQLEMLQKLIEMIQREETLEKLLSCETKSEFFEIIHEVGLK